MQSTHTDFVSTATRIGDSRFEHHKVLKTVPEIECCTRIGRQVQQWHLLAYGVVDMIVKSDVTEELYFQGEMFLDDITDKLSDIRIILLAVLVHQQAEFQNLELLFQDFALFRVQLLDHLEEKIGIRYGGFAVSFFGLFCQRSEVMNV